MNPNPHITEQLQELFSCLPADYPGLTELMVNPNGEVYVDDAKGRWKLPERIPLAKRDAIVKRIAGMRGLVVDASNQGVDAAFPPGVYNGGRFQALAYPLVRGPAFTIRVPSRQLLTLPDLVAGGSLEGREGKFLRKALLEGSNIIIAGETGSGKTTLAKALLDTLRESGERIFTIEDTPEIVVRAPNWVQMISNKAHSPRDCLYYTLRLNPDRIILGEVRDGHTAQELLQAWGTGHGGGITTTHAGSAKQTLTRMVGLLRQVMVNPVREDLLPVLNIIVFMKKKKVLEIYLPLKDQYYKGGPKR